MLGDTENKCILKLLNYIKCVYQMTGKATAYQKVSQFLAYYYTA